MNRVRHLTSPDNLNSNKLTVKMRTTELAQEGWCYDPKGPKQAEAIRHGGLLGQTLSEQCQELDSSTGSTASMASEEDLIE